jgi:multiple sugar transport system ATP-binding protein
VLLVLLVLLGPSGCGNTSTLRIVAGLEDMTSGALWLDDELANDVPAEKRDVAMVFQHGALPPSTSRTIKLRHSRWPTGSPC